MPNPFRYESHLSLPAAAFVASLPRRKQRAILDRADQLAADPFRRSDFRTADAAGHEVENVLAGDFLFT